MAVREILIWPDKRLMEVSAPVAVIDQEIRRLVDDLLETMYADKTGVGLAAPQVGVLKRIVVIDVDRHQQQRPPPGSTSMPLVLINPVITAKEGEMTWEEGCLSLPNETGQVTRATRCTVEFMGLDGQKHQATGEGLAAVAMQHECDHLDGKLFVDYLGRLRRETMRRRMMRLKAQKEKDAQRAGSVA